MVEKLLSFSYYFLLSVFKVELFALGMQSVRIEHTLIAISVDHRKVCVVHIIETEVEETDKTSIIYTCSIVFDLIFFTTCPHREPRPNTMSQCTGQWAEIFG